MSDYPEFQKIPRLSRECFVTEKIDGTNGLVSVDDTGTIIRAGSRSKWITPADDNMGFAKWVEANREELLKLGPGNHYGEWWGAGIQRKYGQTCKRFSLFNVGRWTLENKPTCCDVVPIIRQGVFTTDLVEEALEELRINGSLAAPGFMQPEGVVIYHVALNGYFKKTLLKDEEWKGKK
jgi:hypothetical protein